MFVIAATLSTSQLQAITVVPHSSVMGITLANAAEATSDLWIGVLPQHVRVGPMLAGPVSPLTLLLRELESRPATLKHFLDIIYDFVGPINHGDRAYKLKLRRLLHCSVVHKKKNHRQQEGGYIHFLVLCPL